MNIKKKYFIGFTTAAFDEVPLGNLRLGLHLAIIRVGFCDIRNNQGLCKGYQPQPSASADNPTSNLIVLDITKTTQIIVLLYIEPPKKGSHVFASSRKKI